jgi:aminoglycoside phosphotransferase (APT) family kinase protein
MSRARYYDAMLAALDREVQVELTSDRAKFLYGAARRILARFATANEDVEPLPENLSALHPESLGATRTDAHESSIKQALLHEGRLLDSIEHKVQQRLQGNAASSGAAAAPTTITAETLEAYIRRHLDSKLSLRAFRILAGGRSKQTIMLTLIDEQQQVVERVIRRDLVVAITGATVVDEFHVLKALAERGYPVPRPFLLEADTSVLGSAFMVMEKVNGSLAGDIFDPPAGREAVLHSARVLGKLHALSVAEIAPTLRLQSQIAPNQQQLRDLVLELHRVWLTNSRAHSITMDAVFKWLLDNVLSVSPLVSIVHGDYSYHNLLFQGDSLSAVMDWELVRVGHPAEDLGYIRPAAIQRVQWPEFMEAYRAGGGSEIPQLDITFYTFISKLRLMVLLFGARQYFESGATDDMQLADVSAYHLPRMIQQSSFEIRLALGLVG